MEKCIFTFLLLSFVSCTTNTIPLKEISIYPKESKEIKLSSIAKEIKYLQLETSDAAIIRKISRIKISPQYIFIYSSIEMEPIYVFNHLGKWVRNIGISGRGPGEMNSDIVDFAIDQKDNIFLLGSNGEVSIYSVNGDFIRKFKISGYAEHMEVQGNKIYINFSYPDHYINSNFSIAIYDYYGTHISNLLNSGYLKTSLKDFNETPRDALGIFQTIYDTITYWEPKKDTVYQIYGLKLKPKYFLNREKEFKKRIRGYFESERKVFFPFIIYNNKMTTFIYDKQSCSGNLYGYDSEARLTSIHLFNNDIDNGWAFSPKGCLNGGWLWDYYFPYQLAGFLNSENDLLGGIKTSQKDLLKNPVIMLVK
jgi:hypothetical protein